MVSKVALLRQLARLHGVQTVYYDVANRRRQASVESLLAVLRSLGACLSTLEDVASALRERRQALWQQPLEPVVVAWNGGPLEVELRLPSRWTEAPLSGHLVMETGERRSWEWRGADLPVIEATDVEGTRYVVKQLRLEGGLAWGYHRLALETPGRPVEALVLSAPLKAYSPEECRHDGSWGVFIPLYSLHSRRSWGGGDFSDLEALAEWTARVGGSVVGTLPLLATFLEEPFEPSPYAPASRLFWNEFYLDVARVPELSRCASAQALMESLPFQQEVEALQRLPLVDYRRQMSLKRRVLEELSRCCFDGASGRLAGLNRFLQAHPMVEDYARFRATCDRRRTGWRSWPKGLRRGQLKEGDYDEEGKRYHLYVQWLAHQQVGELSRKAREKGTSLYLDLPLGSHPDGYDVWRWQELFPRGVSAGAPPDSFFAPGQDWGFPPMHPERLREDGYRYYVDCLRHHFRYGGILRVDHVMGFHRLFWVPKGMAASDGVYVRYRAEDFYAILALESHRNQTTVVGEDLGTVPLVVRRAMARHGLLRMYVAPFELTSKGRQLLPPPRSHAVAGLNTHDMPPFAAFWEGLDIWDRHEMGLLSRAAAQRRLRRRQACKKALVSFLDRSGWVPALSADPWSVLIGLLAFLGASAARVVLVNLEDLWLETQPQNVPGTVEERPNWRRKARYPFEAFRQMPQVVQTLRKIDHLRKGRGTFNDAETEEG